MSINVMLNKFLHLFFIKEPRSRNKFGMTRTFQKGYIALITVLIIMSVVLTSTLTATLLSINEAQSGFALFKGEDTLTFVEGCVEDAMLKIRANASYSGASITRPEGTCNIIYNAGGGGPTNWDITVSTTATAYKRSIEVVFTRPTTGSITITSWKEI